MCFLLCITSCSSQLNLVWVRCNLREGPPRGRCAGGNNLEISQEGFFVFALQTKVVFQAERRRTLHCACAIPLRHLLRRSQHIQYSRVKATLVAWMWWCTCFHLLLKKTARQWRLEMGIVWVFSDTGSKPVLLNRYRCLNVAWSNT